MALSCIQHGVSIEQQRFIDVIVIVIHQYRVEAHNLQCEIYVSYPEKRTMSLLIIKRHSSSQFVQ